MSKSMFVSEIFPRPVSRLVRQRRSPVGRSGWEAGGELEAGLCVVCPRPESASRMGQPHPPGRFLPQRANAKAAIRTATSNDSHNHFVDIAHLFGSRAL